MSIVHASVGTVAAAAVLAVLAASSDAVSQAPVDSPTRTGAANVPPVAAPAATTVDAGDRVALFGDLHLHTSYSLDAAAARTETTPDDAYRYAMGQPVTYLGRTVKRRVPLDFLAVTDHAEYLGNVRQVMTGGMPPPDPSWLPLLKNTGGAAMFELFRKAVAGLYGEERVGLTNPALVHNHWQEEIAAAERNNHPGRFTALVAFEYSPTVRANGGHLHRNVIFRGPKYPTMPFGATDSLHHEALWAYAEANRRNGIESLMIPHNTNLSSGMAFALTDSYGQPMTADYARLRASNEPLVEITQIKGTSETRPELSPGDEFADFELIGSKGDNRANYVRPGLLRGLELAESLGVNPFEQGFVGASDFHSGVSSSEEDNYPGALGYSDDQNTAAAEVLTADSPVIGSPLANLSASGITGVWADANERGAIFDALMRREAFATSGPRIRVRLFAGWGDATPLTRGSDWARRAYRWGVPMGGNLAKPAQGTRGPSFVIQAAKDPASGNLDRIQIVKLWRDGDRSFEKVVDVVWAGRRARGADGRVAAVGNTVDAATATYSNSIGAPELIGTWRDPDFDPGERALYYARVIEIPTPRWATYLSVKTGVPLGPTTKSWLQERAWTSPVYYTP
jgi:hypothetical protein